MPAAAEAAPFHRRPGDGRAPAEAMWLTAADGVRLRAALWRPAGPPRAGVLLFPGRTEYVEKYAPFVARLTGAGLAVLAIDWRGQGLSDRLQDDPRPGHVGAFEHYQLDVAALIGAGRALGLPEPWHLLAHSMGGCIGLAALDSGLPVATAAFSAPMWGIPLGAVPQAVVTGLSQLAGRVGRGGRAAQTGRVNTGTYVLDEGFANNVLTHDPDEWGRMVAEADAWPALTLGPPSYDWVGQALRECLRLAAIASPKVPALIAVGSDDAVVDPAAIRRRAAAWPRARLLALDGSRHEPMMERPAIRDAFAAAVLDRFGCAAEAAGTSPPSPVPSHALRDV